MAEPDTERQKLHVKRDGTVCRIYVDFDTSKPMPLASYQDNPVGGFPQTMSEADLKRSFSHFDFVFHDAPSPQKKNDKGPTPIKPEFQAELQRVEKEATKKQGAAPKPSNPGIEVAEAEFLKAEVVAEASGILDQALQEFRVLLAQYYANTGDSDMKIKVEAVAGFILTLWPDVGEKLAKLKDSFEVKKFEL